MYGVYKSNSASKLHWLDNIYCDKGLQNVLCVSEVY
jgi:hypothetical protein